MWKEAKKRRLPDGSKPSTAEAEAMEDLTIKQQTSARTLRGVIEPAGQAQQNCYTTDGAN